MTTPPFGPAPRGTAPAQERGDGRAADDRLIHRLLGADVPAGARRTTRSLRPARRRPLPADALPPLPFSLRK